MSSTPDSIEVAVVAEHPTRNRLLAAILALMVMYASAAAAVLVVPFLFAVLIGLMLAPAVRLLCKWGPPRVLCVSLVMLTALFVVASLFASLITPAREWVKSIPTAIARIEHALVDVRLPLREASAMGERVADMASLQGSQPKQRMVDADPDQLTQLLSATPGVISSFIATLFLIFIFLLHGDALLRKLVELAPALHFKKVIVMATRSAQQELSTYIITITVINCVLGLLLAAALWGMGVASPLLWGGVGAILNFIPFLGPLLLVLLLAVVGFAQFDSVWMALSVPAIFIGLNMLEEVITPHIVGRRLALDPVMVFLALMLCGWLWGPAGLLLAMPLLTCLRILAQRVPSWGPLAHLLSTNA